MEEIWKDIVGYEKRYQVSNLGRVRSLMKRGLILSTQKLFDYLTVHLQIKGKEKVFCIHRLVAGAFIPNPNNFQFVNHIDGNKTNNCADNLEWCTAKMNVEHAVKNGLAKPVTKNVVLTSIDTGEKLFFKSVKEAAKFLGYTCGAGIYSKLKYGDTKNGYKIKIDFKGKIKYPVYQFSLTGGEYLKSYQSIYDAEKETSVSYHTIRACCYNKTKSAGGYIWSFSPEPKYPYSITEKDLSASRKKVGQYSIYGELINTYDSITEASKAVNCTVSNIGHNIHGRTKSAAGYIWKFIDTEDKADL